MLNKIIFFFLAEDSGLVSTIKTAKLSDDEQQSIIEILMSRQGGSISDSWNKVCVYVMQDCRHKLV